MPSNLASSAEVGAPAFKFDLGAATHIGLVRKENQDRWGFIALLESGLTHLSACEDLSSAGLVNVGWALAAVADGMGGHKGGAVAAEIAVQAMAGLNVNSSSKPRQVLPELYLNAHREMARRISQQRTLAEMGSTLSVALYSDGAMWTAHIGDSRIYLIRGGQLRQISEDHSLVQDLVRSGVITPRMAESHPDRNIITRALSGNSYAPPDLYEPIPVQDDDTFLLCSDGLWGMVKEDEILRLIGSAPPQEAAGRLVDAALKQGGVDNIAVIVIKIKQ